MLLRLRPTLKALMLAIAGAVTLTAPMCGLAGETGALIDAERSLQTAPLSTAPATATKPAKPAKLAIQVAQKAKDGSKETPKTTAKEEPDDPHPFPQHVKAPALDGGIDWINTAGPIDLKQLRGKFVVLDFWTYCCINCMHILPELKKLEHAYPNEVVVIGVHSAKFATEQDSKNIREAVLRYEIEHPVVNDALHKIWDKYGVQSWPSLFVIDPEGNVVARASGEVDFESIDRFFREKMPYYRRKGLMDPTPLRFELAAYKAPTTPLRFPGKLLADEKGDRLYISDSNHNRIVVTRLDGTLEATIGSGRIGAADGDYAKATFDHPQGMALAKNLLYVADTENHLIREVDLKKKQVRTIAGTGKQAHGWPGADDPVDETAGSKKHLFQGPALKTAINSPWDLLVHGQNLYIAMAGSHQIWKMTLAKPAEVGVFAGNGREDIVDGPHLPPQPYEPGFSSFAQPSGLSSDNRVIYVADSEGSSIRAVPFDPAQKVTTIVGSAHLPGGRLFTFGDVDGQGEKVLLQHALGLLYDEGVVYVADTYNNKIKVVDPRKATCKTVAGTGKSGADDGAEATFDEPAGLAAANGKLYVADTNNHAIRMIDLKHGNQVTTLAIKGLEAPPAPTLAAQPPFPGATEVELPAVRLKPVDGKVRLQVALELPQGYRINPLAPLRYLIEGGIEKGPIGREALDKITSVEDKSPTFDIELPAMAGKGTERLKISLAYYYCQTGAEGVCKAGSVAWTLPVNVSADAADTSAKLPFKVR